MDVASWLRSLGLEQYEAVFRKNEIDESVLPDLTEDHLRELGFPLGARLKILKAIAALGKHAEAISPSAEAVERNSFRHRRDILNGANGIVLPITIHSLRIEHFFGGNLVLRHRLRGDCDGKSKSSNNE